MVSYCIQIGDEFYDLIPAERILYTALGGADVEGFTWLRDETGKILMQVSDSTLELLEVE